MHIFRESYLLVADTIYNQPCEIRRKLSDVLFIYNLPHNYIDCSDLLSKIGICTHNYLIRILVHFLYLLYKQKYVPIHLYI